jgi:type IV pilus assembly protein PilY1
MGIRLNWWVRGLALLILGCVPYPQAALAQSYTEDFTGATTTNDWYYTGGACLTAGNVAGGGSQPGKIASCASVLNSYYVLQKDGDPKLVGGDQGTVPDNVGTGALRFTNGYPYGHNESGSIVSGFAPFPTTQGVSISFKTITYLGDGGTGGGSGGSDGADGISFFLMDGCVPLAGAVNPGGCDKDVNYGAASSNGQVYKPLGAIGGSLGYTCSNTNPLADGLIGAYLGLGIDEYGNFLNGTNNTLGETGSTNPGGDNTTTGGFYQPGRIGLRGSGSVNFQLLSYLYGNDPGNSSKPYYPAAMNTSCQAGNGVYEALSGKCQTCSTGATYNTTTHSCPSGSIGDHPTYGQAAIQHACSTGKLYNNTGYASGATPTAAGNLDTTNTYNTSKILNYTAIPNGYTVLSSSNPIANESATARNQSVTPTSKRATPIVYNLNITQDGIMNFSLSYNGGSWQNILTNANIKATNGALPPSFRFGFAGSTGGSTNVHEVLCFKATPNDLALNSGGVNDFQNPDINSGTQLFLASYFPTRAWAGSVTALTLGFDSKNKTVAIASTPNWDASCVLTGGTCSSGAPSYANPQATRVMMTWDSKNSTGVAFESGSINPLQQSAIDGDDPTGSSGLRLNFLRGDQTNEIPNHLNLYRTRISLLGDIIDSSPTLVGPPSTYPANIQWADLLWGGTQPEASGESYATFQTRAGVVGRQNVVYVGANDGFLHGFAAGAYDQNNNFVNNTATPNDGHEVLAYMPGAISMIIHNTGTPSLDYSSTQYKHAYFVDATPGTGDVFYNSLWHTLLVGGFGLGGPGIYALDVTTPSLFSETGTGAGTPASTVIGEWTPTTISGCGSCGDNMGTISGVPQIRRFHTGQWGFVFGNGLNSASGDAGIFVALLDQNTGKPSFLYLSAAGATKASPQGNGIVAVSAADIDSDHIVDFVYAGDIKGNLWRFDLTGSTTSQWKLSGPGTTPGPLFKEPFGNPITTQVTVSTLRTIETHLGSGAVSVTRKPERIILNFGTGQQTPQTNNLPAQYSTTQQYLYGIWDGYFNDWNTRTPTPIQPVVSLKAFATITSQGSLVKQTFIENDASTPAFRTMSSNTICWADVQGCSQYGWFVPLSVPSTGIAEQIIFDPMISPDGALIVNTFIPSTNDTLSCSINLPTGFTMALQPDQGSGAPTPFFVINSNQNADGVQLNGTGIPSLIMSGQSADGNAEYLLTQTSNGTSSKPVPTNRHVVTVGQRMNWIERR